MTQFIGIYENAFSKEYCENAIQYFENMKTNGYTKNRQTEGVSKITKDDEFLFGSSVEELNLQHSGILQKEFNDIFWNIYRNNYIVNFSVLQEAGIHNNYSFKMQKTVIGGGYHQWHFESFDRAHSHRLLVWTVYLNDIEEGGETEFLYQHLRVKPKAGTLVIWPASFTHTHRGNPPLSNEKYIVTGWTEF